MAEIYGLDVSHHNGLINWVKVARAGRTFALFKCQYESASHRKDETFDYNYQEAGRCGLARGVYIYLAKEAIDNPKKDAESLLKNLGGRKLELGIWLDLEDKVIGALGKERIKNISKIYIDIFKKAGYKVGIYCNLDWYKRLIHDELKNNYKLWIARYPKGDNGSYNPATALKPEDKNIVMRQYSSKGKIDGIKGNVDLNVMYDNTFIEGAKPQKSTNPFILKADLLKIGSRGDSVKWLQFELNRHGASLVIDGVFGNATKNALVKFQNSHKLVPDGIFGIKTKKAIFDLL